MRKKNNEHHHQENQDHQEHRQNRNRLHPPGRTGRALWSLEAEARKYLIGKRAQKSLFEEVDAPKDELEAVPQMA